MGNDEEQHARPKIEILKRDLMEEGQKERKKREREKEKERVIESDREREGVCV